MFQQPGNSESFALDNVALTFLGFGGIALNALLLAGIIVLTVRYWRLRAQSQQALQASQDDFAALCSAALGVGQRLEWLEDKVRRQTERLEQRELSEPLQQSYRQALQLIDSGADIPTLVEQCGVTRGEAELLENLYRSEHMAKL